MKIKEIFATQILDSRGNPTIKVTVKTDKALGSFCVPSGASTGIHEALELRDGLKAFGGQGVTKAIKNITEKITPNLVGVPVTEQLKIDQIMIDLDGTKNKSKLGANAILGVSCAVAVCASNEVGLPLYKYLAILHKNAGMFNATQKLTKKDFELPDLYMNILNGGKHAENNVDIQETMIVPRAKTLADKVRVGAEVYQALKEVLKSRNLSTGLGDEGGFAPDLESNSKALDMLMEAISRAGYRSGKDVSIALDIAASELYDESKDQKYILGSEHLGLSAQNLVSLYRDYVSNYPVISIEDGLAEDDLDGWKMMTEKLGNKVQLVGDDLFVTNPERIKMGITEKISNAVLIKLNQIGTLSETLNAIKISQKAGFGVMISHRSGETSDTFIADLAVGTKAGQIKSGAPARGERNAKYNRLIEIESELAR